MVQRRYKNYFGGESPRHALTILFAGFVFVAWCNDSKIEQYKKTKTKQPMSEEDSAGRGLEVQRRR
jgi:hypothetical protein